MHASQLVGKQVLRTKPVRYSNGVEDRSYGSGKPVTIIAVTDSHITIEQDMGGEAYRSNLDSLWFNDWTEVKLYPDVKPEDQMTDQERLDALEEAQRLIRKVEFSYPYGHDTRRMIYKVMVDSFSLTQIGNLMTQLKKKVRGY